MATAQGISIDETLFPLVVLVYPPRSTPEDWHGIFDRFARIHARRVPYHVVSDTTLVTRVPTAAERRVLGERTREMERDTERWSVGSAIAVPNAFVRGALTAITWVAPPKTKMTYHASMSEALDEAIAALAAKGISVPEGARALRSRLAAGQR